MRWNVYLGKIDLVVLGIVIGKFLNGLVNVVLGILSDEFLNGPVKVLPISYI